MNHRVALLLLLAIALLLAGCGIRFGGGSNEEEVIYYPPGPEFRKTATPTEPTEVAP